MELNNFQKNTVKHIIDFFQEHNVYLLADETGLGKTVIASEVAQNLCRACDSQDEKKFAPRSVLYIASSLELADENIEKKLKFQGSRVIKGRLSMLWNEMRETGMDQSEDDLNPVKLFALTPSVSLTMSSLGTENERNSCFQKFWELQKEQYVDSECVANLKKKIFEINALLLKIGKVESVPLKNDAEDYMAQFNCYKNKAAKYLVKSTQPITYKQIAFHYDLDLDRELVAKIMISIYLQENVLNYMQYECVPKVLPSILQLKNVKTAVSGVFAENHIGRRYVSILWDDQKDHIDNNEGESCSKMVEAIAGAIQENWWTVYSEIQKNNEIMREINHFLIKKYWKDYYKLLRCYMAYYSLKEIIKPDVVIIDEIQNYPEIFGRETGNEEEQTQIVKLILDAVLGKNSTNQKQTKVLLLSATPYAYRNVIEMGQDAWELDELDTFSKHLVGMSEILQYMQERNGIDCDVFASWKNVQSKMNVLLQMITESRTLDDEAYQQVDAALSELTSSMLTLGISRNERPCKNYRPTDGKYILEKVDVTELADYFVKGRQICGNRLVMSLPRDNADEWIAGNEYKIFDRKVKHIRMDSGQGTVSSRIQAMLEDMLEKNACFYLFMPPNHPTKELEGVFQGSERTYGKTILFSAYNAVPGALRYEIQTEITNRLIQNSGWDKAVFEEKCGEINTSYSRYLSNLCLENDLNTIRGYCCLHGEGEETQKKLCDIFTTEHAKRVILSLYKDQALKNYWACVDHYCKAGNFEAVMDEFNYMRSVQKDQPTISERLGNVINSKANEFSVNYQSNGGEDLEEKILRFNSPFYPFVFLLTSVAEEGHDFHWYSDRIIHWNVPITPIALIQREGRIDRADCMAVRKAIAEAMKEEKNCDWRELIQKFDRKHREGIINPVYQDMFPRFLTGEHENQIMRMCYYYPLSNEYYRWETLMKNLEYYRSMFGASETMDLSQMREIINDGKSWDKLSKLVLDIHIKR